MVNEFGTDTDELSANINELDSYIASLEANSKEMFAAVIELNGVWHGDAKNALVNRFEQDMESFRILIGNLKNLRNNLEKARIAYDQCEKEVNTLVSNLKV